MVRHRNNIVIVKLIRPEIVVLLNGRNFYAKYKMASRKALPKNVAIKNIQKKQKRTTWLRIWKDFKKRFLCSKKIANSKIGKDLAKIAIENTTIAYKKESVK